MVRGAHGQDDDHDEQSPAGRQDGDQGFVVRRLLSEGEKRPSNTASQYLRKKIHVKIDVPLISAPPTASYLIESFIELLCQFGCHCKTRLVLASGLTACSILRRDKDFFLVLPLPLISTS